jgi:hypothetical protein
MKTTAKRVAAIGTFVGALLLTKIAAAQTTTNATNSVSLTNPLNTTSSTVVLANVLGFLVTDIVLPLAVIMVLVGAIQFMTSAGNPEKVSQAKKTLIYAAIGVVVALLATGATSIIQSILGQ